MANSKSALKRIRQNETRRERNRLIRTKTRTACKKFDALAEAGDKKGAEEALANAVVLLDRAASKGIIPHKRADRKKSRLALAFNKIG